MISNIAIQQQQSYDIQNKSLRKAAAPVETAKLSTEESSMIKKNFTDSKPVKLYDLSGSVSEHSFGDRGMNVDTRV